jgi:5-(carboxyamino)imidazole ribonucleotide synthase
MRLTQPLPPNSTIGILGGGQLGRMLALAGARLGLKSHIFAPEPDSPAFQVAAARTIASYQDLKALEEFAKSVDAVTYEFENVPGETAGFLETRTMLAPSARILQIAQDRLAEKHFLREQGIAVAPFAAVDDETSLHQAIEKIGRPAILKTRRFGYDGKGQFKIGTLAKPDAAWAEIGKVPAILEGFVDFDKEISVIAARGWDGRAVVYDVPENEHRNHILYRSVVPATIPSTVEKKARDIAIAIASGLDYAGVIGVEMFVAGNEVLVNEIAPRVHNSGHWTIDACYISQFEQHMRAVAGWPLGEPVRHSDVTMTNLLGDDIAHWRKLAAEPGALLHLYGKAEARQGRKMGHVNRLTPRQG